MTAIAERRLEHLLNGLPPERQAEILAALHNEIAQERQRRLEADVLRGITAGVATKDCLADGAAELLDHLVRLVRAHGCTIAMTDPGGRFVAVASRNFFEPSLPPAGPFSCGLTERLARGRVPVPLPE